MMIASWKLGAAVFAACVIFFGGYRFAAAVYGQTIAELREDYAARALQLEEKYRAQESAKSDALVEAWEARDRALSSASDLRADLERVRVEADRARRALSAAGGDSCDAHRKQLARGAELVARSSELLERCSRLAERTAIDKDALSAVVQ